MPLRLSKHVILKKRTEKTILLIRNYANGKAVHSNTTSASSISRLNLYWNKKSYQNSFLPSPALPFKWSHNYRIHKNPFGSLNQTFVRIFLQSKYKSFHHNVRFLSSYYAMCMIVLYAPFLLNNNTHHSQCESNILHTKDESLLALDTMSTSIDKEKTKKKWKRALLVIKRVIQLLLTFAPVALLYPVHRLTTSSSDYIDELESNELITANSKSSDWYLKLCLKCVESSGAAIIKLMQWASSRPDLFGSRFCSVFCQLQDQTTPHSLRHTYDVMKKAYGNDWKNNIILSHVIGSGCIGQVYKGQIINSEGTLEDVAIKVIHPNVRNNIDADLDILRALAYTLNNLPFSYSKTLKWLNLEGMTEEFASMLKIQLDLRTEAKHLNQFNENFADDHEIIFPEVMELYEPHPDVLIETFCEGIPVLTYAKKNKENKNDLSKLCHKGVKAVCKMIFEDNYVHSDLHPGNIFVSPCGKKLIILDAGIATEYNESDHQLIVSILKSFIHGDGRRAGELMIEDSNHRRMMELKESGAVDKEGYIDKIEDLTKRANGKDYFMEHLGTYISYICEAAATHHVLMNQSFVSICLAVKVQEGLALSLDPGVEIWRIANPIILRADLNRRVGRYWENLKKEIDNVVSFKSI